MWQQRVTNMAEYLALSAGSKEFPIALKKVAESRKIKEVVFRPLLIDACIGGEDDGFTVYVGCETERIEDSYRRWNDVRDGGRSLRVRTRFTIAHEICHTFFFGIEGKGPRRYIDVKHHGALKSMERACDKAAARILLPEPLLRAEMGRIDILDAQGFVSLREKTAVSVECLLLRIKESSVWSRDFGAIAYVRKHNGEFLIERLIIHPVLCNVFPKAVEGEAPRNLIYDDSLSIYGGYEHKVVVEQPVLVGSRRATQSYRVTCERIYGYVDSFILTVRSEGRPKIAERRG
jgi:hypothetical protein